jgi:hypothetical protein
MIRRTLSAAALALSLTACATAPGPVEVTRFVAPTASTQLAQGPIFVQSAAGEDNLELAPYKAAVAAELVRQGYRESARAGAGQIAEVRVERYRLGSDGGRNPVSVGVGGSTGSYGSGVGLGVGINLGGGSRNQVGTEMRVVIRDAASSQVLWEGRADFAVAENSALADRVANAQTVAAALFSEFPGNNGETVQVEVQE